MRVHVDKHGRMQYEGAFVSPQAVASIFKKKKLKQGYAVALVAEGEVSLETLFRCRNDLIAEGVSTVDIISSRKATSTAKE